MSIIIPGLTYDTLKVCSSIMLHFALNFMTDAAKKCRQRPRDLSAVHELRSFSSNCSRAEEEALPTTHHQLFCQVSLATIILSGIIKYLYRVFQIRIGCDPVISKGPICPQAIGMVVSSICPHHHFQKVPMQELCFFFEWQWPKNDS